jgi:hypothetical protein
MLSVVLGMLFCVLLALAVLVVVAVPARRSGRDLLTERGEEVVGALRQRTLPPRTSETGSVDDVDPLAVGLQEAAAPRG